MTDTYRILIRALLALPVTAFAIPQAAHACLFRELETYMLVDRQPTVPEGAVTLKVRVTKDDRDGIEARATIIEPAPAIFGAKTIRLRASDWNSCSRWGLIDDAAYVVGYLRRDANGALMMQVIQNRWAYDPAYPKRPGQHAPFTIIDGTRTQ